MDIKILLAPDSFKESLPANEVCHFLKKGIHSVDRNLKVAINPVSDGGEGILEVLVEAKHGEIIETRVSGPLGEPVIAKWGMIEDKGSTAIIEIAEAAGLMLIPVDERNPLETFRSKRPYLPFSPVPPAKRAQETPEEGAGQ